MLDKAFPISMFLLLMIFGSSHSQVQEGSTEMADGKYVIKANGRDIWDSAPVFETGGKGKNKSSREVQIRPVSHKIKAQFFLEEGRLVAQDEVLLHRSADAWSDVGFTLWSQLEIDQFLIDEQSVPFTYGPGKWFRQVTVAKEFLPATQKQAYLTVSYAGKPVCEQEGSWHTIISPEIVSFSPSYFPWFPQFDRSLDSAADVTFAVPSGYTVVASGRLTEVNSHGDWDEWTWHTDRSGERFAFVIRQYTSREICVEDTPLSVHLFPEDAQAADAILEEAKSIFLYYSDHLGKYPLERFAVAALPDTIRGGYAEDSFIKVQRSAITPEDSYGLPHEMAHNWRTCGKGPGWLWLDESLAEYMAYRYKEFCFVSPEIARETRKAWALSYFDLVAEGKDYLLMDYHPDRAYALYYKKGAWVWHILRQILGDEVFDEVLLEFHRRYLLKPVTVDDFRAVCEETSGETISWFFREWMERTGVPMLELTDIVITPVEGGFLTAGAILQQGDIYRLPVEIGVEIEERYEIHRIWIESAETRFEFKTKERPEELTLDPEANLLRAPGAKESLKTPYGAD